MKTYQAMKVTLVGNVTEVVLGSGKHSGRGNSRRSRSRSSYGNRNNRR